MDAEQLFQELKKTKFNLDFSLKKEQITVLDALLERKDVIAILPTGFGKSMCYSLLPLMYDQVSTLNQTSVSHDLHI